jgi:alpha-D-xyloside xylohydrolase
MKELFKTIKRGIVVIAQKNLNNLILMFLLSLVLQACGSGDMQQTADGVIVTPGEGSAKKVRLQVMNDKVVRVTAVPHENLDSVPASLMVTAQPAGGAFSIEKKGGKAVLQTAAITAEVALDTGVVTFLNKDGEVLLAEHDRGSFGPVTADPAGADADSYAIHQQFNRDTDEGFYGLGQHQNGQFNYNGEDVELAQHNMDIAVPFVVSTRNYGLLWDNHSITRFGDPREYQPLNVSMKLYDAEGKEGGLTASYYNGDGQLKVARVEADPNYQYLKDKDNWPAEFTKEVREKDRNMRVVFAGSIESPTDGVHKFRMYSSGYAKLLVDDTVLHDRWRQNWNPWYHNFDLAMKAGERKNIRVEWTPQDGYFRLLHLDPLPKEERHQLSLASETGKAIDYYFVIGSNADEVIAGYRSITGKSVMLPRWAYGFWQSRQRYKTQDELLGVLQEYRKRQIPIDNIVLDWFYWKEDSWGSHEFDPARFPDPKGMVQKVHDLNAQIMISVWAKFYPTTDNFKELDAKGYIYRRNIEQGAKDWVGPGYLSSFYDPYSEEARNIYWRQINERLNVLGFDAWWLDSTEPDMHSNLDITERKLRMGPTALGTGAEYFNSYPLPHAEGVYLNDRKTDPDKRVFILTRSAFGGLQRTASAIWSGDVTSRWDDLREQISAGINTGLSGLPNWTFDIGGFALEDRYTKQEPAHVNEWRELNLRWFQFGAFAPLFRSHGEEPFREIFNLAPEGSPVYDSMVWFTKLRYRLIPYIYSQAGDMYHKDGTLMRAMVMDFPQDPAVRNIGDQYMFGPAILVAPVYEYMSHLRELYLPAGSRWYDFYTGLAHEGGQRISAVTPISRMPLYVKAGSIIPTGPAVQYTGQLLNAPLTLLVYTGANGAFELYEDDGNSYAYENGGWSRIPMSYDETTGTLTIDKRIGEFVGMAKNRTVHIRWISGEHPDAANFDAAPAQSVEYAGEPVVVKRP